MWQFDVAPFLKTFFLNSTWPESERFQSRARVYQTAQDRSDDLALKCSSGVKNTPDS